MKKLIALIISFVLISSTSCGGDGSNYDNSVADDESTSSAREEVTERNEISDDLPEADFKGYTFKIIGREDNFVYQYELGSDEQNGEVINDAAYIRNSVVEERLNIEIQRIYNNNNEITSSVRKTALAGEDAYDLIINAAYSVPTLATENLLIDWYDIKYIDFERPWWSTEAISELSVNDHSFFATGDLCISNIGIAMCIFYNKTLGAEYQLDNIYNVVNSGKWTYDYFNDLVKGIHKDLNGDSLMDKNDIYGFGNNIGSTLQPFVFSLGSRFTEKDDTDIPRLSMNNEKFIDVFEKVYSLHMENEGVIAHLDYTVPRSMFANGQIVFNTGAVYHSGTLYRDMKDDIGVLPFPKADEAMEKYYTCHDPNVSLMAIPKTASDLDRTGFIVEALAIESYKTLTPAFFETALKVKYSRDDETVQALDMIKKGVTFDFAVLYGSDSSSGNDKLAQCMKYLLKDNSKEFSSYYAEYAPSVQAYFNEIIKIYQSLD